MTTGDPPPAVPVRAGGGVVGRLGDNGSVEVVLVHRSRYDDWTFPKGKLDPGEGWEQAAVREVFEETGIVPVLGTELTATEYRDHQDRPKRVRYWAMSVAATAAFEPNEEISGMRWMSVEEAAQTLTYGRDLPVLRSFVATSAQGDEP